MFIIMSYDIGSKRVKKAMKICRKYLSHVQKSVFEGEITETNLKRLKDEMRKVVNTEDDSVCIYKTDSIKSILKQQLGKTEDNSHII